MKNSNQPNNDIDSAADRGGDDTGKRSSQVGESGRSGVPESGDKAPADAASDHPHPTSHESPIIDRRSEAGSTKEDEDRNEVEHSEAVVRLFSQHQRWLFSYLMTLLGNPDDAEDVLQEVSVVMWREHRNFELGTNFAGWLSIIAYHQAQKFWRTRKKANAYLDTRIIEQLAQVVPKDQEAVDSRKVFLAECMKQLPERDRVAVETVYAKRESTIKDLAQKLGKPESRFYKSLARIRKTLFECVARKLAAEGLT